MATAPQHVTSLASMNRDVSAWVDDVAKLTQPDHVYWCDGSPAEFQVLKRELIAAKELLPLNPQSFPGCVLSRSNPSDVARVEHLTFVCTKNKDDAGPNNHWIAPAQAHAQMDALFAGCMKGRTLYVVPYCMGPIDSPFSRCGVEITDSAYVVLNMQLMTRMGHAALERITHDGKFVKGLHSTGDLNPKRRFIMHFPEELSIKSFGSGYGGNALLGRSGAGTGTSWLWDRILRCRTQPGGGGGKCWNASRRVGRLVMTRMRPDPSCTAIRAVVASPVTRGPMP